MAQQDPDLPIESSKPAPVLVTRRFDDFEAFSLAYAGRLSLSGLFVAAIEPLPVGATVHVDFQLNDGFRLFHGVGEVVWVRPAAFGPDLPSGMGVRFLALDETGRELILKLLEDHIKSGGAPFELEPPPEGAVTVWEPPAAAVPSGSGIEVEPEPADPMDFAPPWQTELPDIPADLLTPDSDLEPIPHSAADEDDGVEELEERGSDGLAAAVARLEPLPGGARADDSQPVSLEMESVDAALDFGLDPAEGWVQDEDSEPPSSSEDAPAPTFEAPEPTFEAPEPAVAEPARDVAAPEARAQSWLAEPEPAAAEPAVDEPPPSPPSPSPPSPPSSPPAEIGADEAMATPPPAPARRPLLPLVALLALAAVAAAGWLTRESWLPAATPDPIAGSPDRGSEAPREVSDDRPGALPDTLDDGAADAAFADDAFADDALADDALADDALADDASTDEVSTDEVSAEDIAAEEVPADDFPADDFPADDFPADGRDGDDTASLEATPPLATPPASASPASPAAPGRRLENISWRETAEGTLVVFEADGPLAAERLSWSQLGGANPRLLFRLRDIAEPYRANRIPVASAAVQRIRTGFHPLPAGDELHVVLDLAGPGFALARAPAQRADGRIEILIAAP